MDTLGALLVTLSVAVLLASIISVARSAKRRRDSERSLAASLMRMAESAWGLRVAARGSLLIGNRIGLTDAIIEGYRQAGDGLGNAGELGRHLILDSGLEGDAKENAIDEFVDAFLEAGLVRYTFELRDAVARAILDGTPVQEMTAYLRATVDIEKSLLALREGIPPEYAGAL
jgi:hypothetical protein